MPGKKWGGLEARGLGPAINFASSTARSPRWAMHHRSVHPAVNFTRSIWLWRNLLTRPPRNNVIQSAVWPFSSAKEEQWKQDLENSIHQLRKEVHSVKDFQKSSSEKMQKDVVMSNVDIENYLISVRKDVLGHLRDVERSVLLTRKLQHGLIDRQRDLIIDQKGLINELRNELVASTNSLLAKMTESNATHYADQETVSIELRKLRQAIADLKEALIDGPSNRDEEAEVQDTEDSDPDQVPALYSPELHLKHVQTVEEMFGYQFEDHALVWQALQFKRGSLRDTRAFNKRLAMEGDAALKLALITSKVAEASPDFESSVSKVGDVLSNKHMLNLGRRLGLHKLIFVTQSNANADLRSAPAEHHSRSEVALGTTMEAIFCLIYRQGGIKALCDVLEHIAYEESREIYWQRRIHSLTKEVSLHSPETSKVSDDGRVAIHPAENSAQEGSAQKEADLAQERRLQDERPKWASRWPVYISSAFSALMPFRNSEVSLTSSRSTQSRASESYDTKNPLDSPGPTHSAIEQAIELSKRLSASDTPSRVTDTGHFTLDVSGDKTSGVNASQAEVIARKMLSEGLVAKHDIGAKDEEEVKSKSTSSKLSAKALAQKSPVELEREKRELRLQLKSGRITREDYLETTELWRRSDSLPKETSDIQQSDSINIEDQLSEETQAIARMTPSPCAMNPQDTHNIEQSESTKIEDQSSEEPPVSGVRKHKLFVHQIMKRLRNRKEALGLLLIANNNMKQRIRAKAANDEEAVYALQNLNLSQQLSQINALRASNSLILQLLTNYHNKVRSETIDIYLLMKCMITSPKIFPNQVLVKSDIYTILDNCEDRVDGVKMVYQYCKARLAIMDEELEAMKESGRKNSSLVQTHAGMTVLVRMLFFARFWAQRAEVLSRSVGVESESESGKS